MPSLVGSEMCIRDRQTYKSVWNAHIALATKLRLYNTCILPIIRYASECWAPTKADGAFLDAFDQWCLRRLLGITWQDHITNIEVHERTGLPAVNKTISQRRLSILSHVSRMPPSSTKTFFQTGGDDPVDLNSPGWLPYTEICGNLILTFTMFLSLLPIVYCALGCLLYTSPSPRD